MEKYIYSEQELPQKSEKWLEFRRNGIGASEISAILGKLPPHWANDYEIFLRKLGKVSDFSSKHMERGVLLEDSARKTVTHYLNYCKKTDNSSILCSNYIDKTKIKPEFTVKFEQLTVKYKNFDKIFASFDGVDLNNKMILEIKCPSQSTFTKMTRARKIPSTYFSQIQTQLMVANSHWGITKGLFANFYPEGIYIEDKVTGRAQLKKLVILEVDFDPEYCKELEIICKKFWKMVENNKWNNNWKNE